MVTSSKQLNGKNSLLRNCYQVVKITNYGKYYGILMLYKYGQFY
jgi:hypothetical protein